MIASRSGVTECITPAPLENLFRRGTYLRAIAPTLDSTRCGDRGRQRQANKVGAVHADEPQFAPEVRNW